MQNARAERLLRWFLLLWLGLIYIWGLQLMGLFIGRSEFPAALFPGVPIHLPHQVADSPCISHASLAPSLLSVVFFTVLIVCHAGLYWLGLSLKMPRHWRYLYLAAQGLLVGVMSLSLFMNRCAVPALPAEFIICLYLALIVGAISILEHARAIIAVVAGYLLLLAVNMMILERRTPLLFSLQSSIWYAAVILFVVGYIIVYLYQLRIHSQLQVAHADLKASAARIEELTLVNERQRLARELHDTLAQGLAGVLMQLEVANAHLSQHHMTSAQEIIHQAIYGAREALVDARSSIDDLRARTTGASELSAAVQKEIHRFTATTGIPCTSEIPQRVCASPILREHIVGILCEGLTNITRHAQAHQVWVSLVQRDDTLEMEVRDDGIGFDPAVVATQPWHYGLIGLRERAHLVNGHLAIRSVPGMGTSVRLRVVVGQQARETPESGQIQSKTKRERGNRHA